MIVARQNIYANIDWLTILIWVVMVAFGWMNIYSANFLEVEGSVFDFSMRYGKQLLWIGASLLLALVILIIDAKFYSLFAYILYGIIILILTGVLVFGKEINGARSWFVLGGLQLQPSEFAKPFTALALARILSSHGFMVKKFSDLMKAGFIILLPAALILLQPDMGTSLVFFTFVFVLFREGFSANTMMLMGGLIILFILTLILDKFIIIAGIAGITLFVYYLISRSLKDTLRIFFTLVSLFLVLFAINHFLKLEFDYFRIGLATVIPLAVILAVKILYRRQKRNLKLLAGALIGIFFVISVDYGMNHILKEHQQHRIYVTLGLENDPRGVGYNVNQSKIAIGSGGFSGKGFLEGTQTKLHFVPEQSTDFIFCTVGEEWGFLGTAFVVLLYIFLLLRLIKLAERQRSSFSRIFGYGLLSVLFVHFVINIGMTIGLFPVVGIPLPFFSYGGSSLWGFTIFLFIFLRLDASRLELLG
ncbi:MAG: rod shape-determining protein RodA [Bacteroidales bacterium]|nr:rod shape-determining protein RodA [Bacteroidales bacterium]MBN2699594.1 rod shape-determining protein RodA [Bacteroidales bacterium]